MALDSVFMGALDEITALLEERNRLKEQLPTLVCRAFDEGHKWHDVAHVLGVSKARVYQLRSEGLKNR